jgi:signal transduction histidine kinase
VPAPVATAVYRVAQEALTNTVRHAQERRATVTLSYAPASAVVDVRDDGRGGAAIVDGHGIAGMRERVAALGGAPTRAITKLGVRDRVQLVIVAFEDGLVAP